MYEAIYYQLNKENKKVLDIRQGSLKECLELTKKQKDLNPFYIENEDVYIDLLKNGNLIGTYQAYPKYIFEEQLIQSYLFRNTQNER